MEKVARGVAAVILLLCSGRALAHMMGVVYNLPIPFWMYAFAASAALGLSFLVVGYFVTAQSAARNFRTIDVAVRAARAPGATVRTMRALSVFARLLTILTGLPGPSNAYASF